MTDKLIFNRSLSFRIFLALGAIYLIWGSTYLSIRLAVETIPPYLMTGMRFLIAGLIMYAWARMKGAASPKFIHWRSAAVVGALLLLGGNSSVAWAEQRVPSGIAALIIATVPLWMVLLDWLWHKGERPRLNVSIGILLGFTGIVLLVAPGKGEGATHIDLLGAAVLLFAALCWATGSLYSRKASLPKSPLLATGMEMLAGGATVVLAGLLSGEGTQLHIASVTGTSFLAWLYLMIFGSIIGFTCYIWLLRASSPALVSTYAYVNPVIAVFLGWLLAGEAVSLQTLLATAVIITAVVLITTRFKRRSSAVVAKRLKRQRKLTKKLAADC